MQFGIRQYELAQYPVGMKKHHKITAPERDQIAWWLACGITIRDLNLGPFMYQKRPFLRQESQITSTTQSIKATTNAIYTTMHGKKPQRLLYGQKGNTAAPSTTRNMINEIPIIAHSLDKRFSPADAQRSFGDNQIPDVPD